MAYVDVNTPVIDRITLPSGNTYYIADREIRDVVDILSQAIAGGVSFIVAWDGTSTPVVAEIPYGVIVLYNDTYYTGTFAADSAIPGAFYLVKSSTQVGIGDAYDEYVPVGDTGSKTWEKIGDGRAYVQDLPFVNDDLRDQLLNHINNPEIHVTMAEKLFWNNKINVNDASEVVNEALIFNRN